MVWSFLLVGIIIAGLVALYLFFIKDEAMKKILLVVLLAAVVLSIIFLAMVFSHGPHRIRAKLKEIEPLLSQQSAEMLKEKYVEIYTLYMKLPEKWKSNFYAKISGIREQVEEQLKAEKKVVFLLEQADKAAWSELRQLYDELYTSFQKLPQQVQEHYYSRIIMLKEKLGKGS